MSKTKQTSSTKNMPKLAARRASLTALASQIAGDKLTGPAPNVPAPFAKIAAELKEGGMPDTLNRWNDMTSEKLAENEKAREAIVKQTKNMKPKKLAPVAGTISSGLPKGGLDAAGKKLKAQIETAKEQSKMERLKLLREAKANSRPRSSLKSSELRDQINANNAADAAKLLRENAVKKFLENGGKVTKVPAGETAAKAARKPAGAPKTAKATHKAPAAKLAPAASAAPKKGNGNGAEPRKGSKTALIADLLKRKQGCTTADVLDATGWPAVSMPQQAKVAGLKLRKEKQGKVTRYWAS